MKSLEINNAVWKEGDYFVAQCLNIEVSSFGNTKDEALSNLQEALELYFEDNDNPGFVAVAQPEIAGFTLKYA